MNELTPKDYGTWKLYRSKISYFSGKIEAYLKYKKIPVTISEIDGPQKFNRIYKYTGVKKMPAMEAENGHWLFDTTAMIQFLEDTYPGLSVIPEDPALRFLALLLEDYGDEWLWRPAMWWRWVPMGSRRTLGWTIGSEIINKNVGRQAGWFFAKRQMQEWLWGDGVDSKNEKYVKDMLDREFEFLEPLLEERAFILGTHPSIADYGYFASMFRHFGNDPDPAEYMRMNAPNTYEWLARLWNAKQDKLGDNINWQWPQGEFAKPLLDRIANDYLPYLAQNAEAYFNKKNRFNFQGKNVNFPKTKTTHYRVWCFENLQKSYQQLDDYQQKQVEEYFSEVGGLAVLKGKVIDSKMGPKFKQPVLPNDARLKQKNLAIQIGGQARN